MKDDATGDGDPLEHGVADPEQFMEPTLGVTTNQSHITLLKIMMNVPSSNTLDTLATSIYNTHVHQVCSIAFRGKHK